MMNFAISSLGIVAGILATISGAIATEIVPAISPIVEAAAPKATVPKSAAIAAVSAQVTPKVFTTGLSVAVDRRLYERVPGALVRGYENGEQAVDLASWLVPFDSVLKALQIKTKALADGQVELRSATNVVRVDLSTIATDPELGLVLSVKQIEQLFGLTATFDFRDYAIVLQLPDTSINGNTIAAERKPVLTAGLPQVQPQDFTPSMVEQRVRSTGTTVSEFKTQGTLLAVGTVLGGSWYAEIDQPQVLDARQWQLTSLQYLRQTPQRDLFVGTQPTFWQSRSAGDFWGVTTIGRQGYAPPEVLGSGGGDPMARMQPSAVTGTLNGYAEPGTLVRLVRGGEGGLIVAEQLVDGTGRYQFKRVAIGRDADSGTNYRILLYPRGQLNAQPLVETPRLTILPDQLPQGTSSNILSAGWRRTRSTNSLVGEFGNFNAGVAQRWGLSESLTVGVGAIYDNDRVQGLGEFFLQPKGSPLRLVAIGQFDAKSTLRADAVWDDYPTLYAQVSYTPNKTQYAVDLPLVKSSLRFLVNGDTDRGTAWGLQYSGLFANGSTYGRVTLQPNQQFSWELFQSWNRFNISHRKRDGGMNNSAAYQINPWNAITLEYNTSENFRSNQLASVAWRYRSRNYQIDGSSMWTATIGYGVGSQGHGPNLAIATSVLPGWHLQARYQAVSLASNTGEYSVALTSSFGTQSGIYAGNRRLEELRSAGGILVQPFYDRNSNGQRDRGEEFYTESADFLILNNELVQSQRLEKHADRFLLRLVPGMYRLDLEAAGFPVDFQPVETAIAVKVHEGSYTPILIPLQPAYTASGVISRSGQPVNGARVEATNIDSNQTQLATTNTAGVYYLEPLRRGRYRVTINGQPAQPEVIQITESSPPLEEINFIAP
jgi:Carboxypeptidase regulatory-like domain